MAYTVKVTVASTLASMAAVQLVSKATGWLNVKFNTGTTKAGKFFNQLTADMLRAGVGSTAVAVVYSCIKESMEETMIDPWMESLGSGMAASMGFGRTGQLLGGMLLESGRETALGPITNMFKTGDKSQISFEEYLGKKEMVLTGQQLMEEFNDYKNELKTRWMQKSWWLENGEMLLSSIGLFAPALIGI